MEGGLWDVLGAKSNLVDKVRVKDGPPNAIGQGPIWIDGGSRTREVVIIDVGAVPDEPRDCQLVLTIIVDRTRASVGGGVCTGLATIANARHGG